MTLNRTKLYLFLMLVCLAGYTWLYYSFKHIDSNIVGVCILKHVTNLPCPSCGSTRSVISLFTGNFLEAFRINPLGYVVVIIMLFTPLWITFDIITKRKTLVAFYQKSEIFLKRPHVAIPLILLIIINWIWNITKGL